MHRLVWPLMQWSTDPDHNSVHVHMQGQMHVHGGWWRGYSLTRRPVSALTDVLPGPAALETRAGAIVFPHVPFRWVGGDVFRAGRRRWCEVRHATLAGRGAVPVS
ncbi:hypothetical protein GCM10010250_05580 [Streptomyces althioticus]|nr:hypothetical protein GCM10010250_05580 [Streptomyces althioticus]